MILVIWGESMEMQEELKAIQRARIWINLNKH